MKQIILVALILAVAACGRSAPSKGRSAAAVPAGAPVAFGPISKACLASDRDAKSRALCGCIQWAANQTLSNTQQRRAVKFYKDPHLAQEIRQSDRPANEKFWLAYKAYGEAAQAVCGPQEPEET